MFFEIINIIGLVAFAVSGALKGLKHRLDILGVMILGVIVAVGGGIVRDVMLGRIPQVFNDNLTVPLLAVVSILTFFGGRHIENHAGKVKIFDAFGLAAFTVVGVKAGLDFNLGLVGIIFMGTVNATAGGMMRDLFVRETPFILKEEIYATFCIIGALLFYILVVLAGVSENIVAYIVVAFILSGRLLSMKYDLHLPRR